MLILDRFVGETLRIGDDIEIVVTRVDGDYVRLGVAAPPQVAVFREEIYKRIRRERMNPPVRPVHSASFTLPPATSPPASIPVTRRKRRHWTPPG